jgi:hypothetical protein
MISSESRYVDSPLYLAYDARREAYHATAPRRFPLIEGRFFWYTWKNADRIDMVAQDLLGDATLWWQIMDMNPEVLNPLHIPPGTQVRIPSGA